MEDYYTIQTPEHHTSLFSQLHALQKQGVMCDVILAAEDGEVMAHKVILMAVSKYFREKLSPVISATPTRVFLKGIPVIELANLVKYIYTGKLLIAKETMDITLEVAEILQLNGVINGYKEILAYEQMKGQAPRNSIVTVIKPDKDSSAISALNIQIDNQSTEQGTESQEQYYLESEQKSDSVALGTEGSAVVSDQGSGIQTSTHNTSTEFAFETNLYEDQYYDVSVGSSVSVQSDTQINTMPSLKKMTNTVSMEENQAQHQDLLSVAIETLTDANYLSSPPSKEHRHVYTSSASQAISSNTIYSNAETVSAQNQYREPISAISPTPVSMIVASNTASSADAHKHAEMATADSSVTSAPTNKSKGNIPVYRVSLPPSMNIYGKVTRGRPSTMDNTQTVGAETRGRPRRNESEKQKIEVSISPATRKLKGGKLIVSPQLTAHSQKQNEIDLKTSETRKRFPAAKIKDITSDNSSSTLRPRTRRNLKVTDEFNNDGNKIDDDLNKIVNNLKTRISEKAEDFGQSVNFDSDDDHEVDSNDEFDAELSVNNSHSIQEMTSKTDSDPQILLESSAELNEEEHKTSSIVEESSQIGTLEKEKQEDMNIIISNDEQENRDSKSATEQTDDDEAEVKSDEKMSKVKVTKTKKSLIQANSGAKNNKKAITKQNPDVSNKLKTRNQSKVEAGIIKESEELTKLKTPKGKNQPKVEKGCLKMTEEIRKVRTPKGKNQPKAKSDSIEENVITDKLTQEGQDEFVIEIDNAELDVMSNSPKDIRSSASKRKCKVPRRLIDNETKGNLKQDIPMVRTRRYSRNESSNQDDRNTSNGHVMLTRKSNNKDNTSDNVELQGLTKEKRESLLSTNNENDTTSGKQNLQPVVKLAKQSKGEIKDMARKIATSKSPSKRQIVEVEQTDASEPVKKKSKKPTELPPVTALKNRQKTVEEHDDNSGGDDDDEEDNDDDEKSFESNNNKNSESASLISCKKCDKTFKYKIQLNKHSKICKVSKSNDKNNMNTFMDSHRGNTTDLASLDTEKRSSSGTPDPESMINVEIIEFSKTEGKGLDKIVKIEKDKEEKGKLYICSEKDCYYSSESSAEAVKHRKVHQEKFKCEDCGSTLQSKQSFNKHKKSNCSVSDTKNALTDHQQEHKKNDKDSQPKVPKTVQCIFCEEEFTSKQKCWQHEAEHDEAKHLTCACCNYTYNTLKDYKIHVRTQKRRSVNTVCVICDKKFSRAGDQRKHMFKFHGVQFDDQKSLKMFPCDICSYIAWSQRTLDNHKKAHAGVKDTPCPTCKKMFLSQYEVNRHVKMVHGSFRGRFKCTYEGCTYSTAAKRCLQTHTQLKHNPTKVFRTCQFCEYQTQLKGNLDKHIKLVHNLEVVSKQRLKNMKKYGDLKPGTIITPDGREQITNEDIGTYKKTRFCLTDSSKTVKRGTGYKKRRPKSIEEFTQHIMAQHMKRLATPQEDKDYLSPVLKTAINQPQFPQASVSVRRHRLAVEKGITDPPKVHLLYDQMEAELAHQYTIKEEIDGLEQEIIVEDGIVPVPSTGVSVGNEVYIIEAGKSDNVIEGPDLMQPVGSEMEDETSRQLRMLTSLADRENEDETTRSLRVLTTLLEAGQNG